MNGHWCSWKTPTIVATEKDSTTNTRKLYKLQDTGCSSSILSDNNFNDVKPIKKSKSYYSTTGGPTKLVGLTRWYLNYQNFSHPKKLPGDCGINKGIPLSLRI